MGKCDKFLFVRRNVEHRLIGSRERETRYTSMDEHIWESNLQVQSISLEEGKNMMENNGALYSWMIMSKVQKKQMSDIMVKGFENYLHICFILFKVFFLRENCFNPIIVWKTRRKTFATLTLFYLVII